MTPLVLVVGFLGAGKTTFLKNLLPQLRDRKIVPHVIINDYQNAKVDAEQLRELTDAVDAISGDCVCCGSRDELLAALEKFPHGPNKVVIVETNGTTDSEQLIEMLSLEPDLKGFSLPLQVSLIDAKRWQKRFWHNALEREQARTATHLVLSRQDEVDAKRVAEVESSFSKHHISGRKATLTDFADELAELCRDSSGQKERAPIAHCCDCGGDHHHHDHAHAHHDHHFASMEVPLPAIVSRKAFDLLLRDLPEEVVRAKGLVCFDDAPSEFFVFQKVDRFDEPQFFSVGQAPRVKIPLALFIGPKLPEGKIREAVSGLQAA